MNCEGFGMVLGCRTSKRGVKVIQWYSYFRPGFYASSGTRVVARPEFSRVDLCYTSEFGGFNVIILQT